MDQGLCQRDVHVIDESWMRTLAQISSLRRASVAAFLDCDSGTEGR